MKKTVKYGNMTLEDHNEDGSWWHCIDCEVDFCLSRKELLDRGIKLPVTLTVGKIYELRGGLKTSPLRKSNNGTNYIYEADVQEIYPTPSILAWLGDGSFLDRRTDNPRDIVTQLN